MKKNHICIDLELYFHTITKRCLHQEFFHKLCYVKKSLQGKNHYSVFWMNKRYLMVCTVFLYFFNFCNINCPCNIPLPTNVWFVVYINNKCQNHACFGLAPEISLCSLQLWLKVAGRWGGGGYTTRESLHPHPKICGSATKKKKRQLLLRTVQFANYSLTLALFLRTFDIYSYA